MPLENGIRKFANDWNVPKLAFDDSMRQLTAARNKLEELGATEELEGLDQAIQRMKESGTLTEQQPGLIGYDFVESAKHRLRTLFTI